MHKRSYQNLCLFLALSTMTFVLGCSSPKSTTPAPRVSPIYAAGPAELPYCSTPFSYTGTTSTITGTAYYKARIPTALGANPRGLGAAGSNTPIRRAEVRVTEASGNLVQCAETDNSGNFSFVLTTNSATYTITINSRGKNSYVDASVMNRPESNVVYSISTTVVPDSSKSVGSIVADVTGSVPGAPFNIFDQIVKTNDYLRAEVGTCSFAGCQAFTVAPHVQAYWEKGFNPNDYFGPGNGGVSFYLPGYSRLFVLGGVNGDIDSTDTDHFDNSVIIHEYGHFVEDVYTKTDSPGGAHNGNGVIDPRLAWGEGWGNFLQAAVRNDPTYIDTVGNTSGTSDFAIYVGVEEADAACGSPSPPPVCDVPDNAGEGNFREFEITRFLWDVIDTNDEGGAKAESITNGFPEIWTALTSTSGFNNTSTGFRSVGLLHQIQSTLSGGTDWDPLRTLANHRHGLSAAAPVGYRSNWATYVTASGNCSIGSGNQRSITPSGSYSYKNLLINNDFYYYKHPGGAITLQLKYKTTSGSEADLDLFIYDSTSRIYGDSSVDIASNVDNQKAKSDTEPDGNIATTEVETVTPTLEAGDYLIKVQAFVSAQPGGPTDYELEVGGVDLCPATQP